MCWNHKHLTIACVAIALVVFGQAVRGGELYGSRAEERELTGVEVAPGVSVGGLVEVEASYQEQGDEESSDLVLATFELDIDAELNEYTKAHVLLLWEEDDTEPVDLDEATITLGGSENMPLYIEAGKMYVPFGGFKSHLVSDPLVVELGETRGTAACVGYTHDLFEIKLGAFNGDVDEDEDDDVQDLVASITATPIEGLELGAYWISDLGESGGLEEGLQDVIEGTEDSVIVGADGTPAVEPGTPGVPYEEVGGAGGYISLTAGRVTIEAEMLGAVDAFEAGLLGEEELQPLTWNVEIECAACERWLVAVRYEGSDEFPGQPENQYGGAVGFCPHEQVCLAVEYLHGEFEDDVDERNVVTTQLAMEF